MLISKKHNALILKLRDPERVLTVIPKSKELIHEGQRYVVVKHGVEEVKVLRNIGIEAPSPILTYYGWPSRFPTRFAHQEQTAAFMSLYNRAFCLSSMGTMKSISTLWAYDYLREVGLLHKALILAPLSTLERVWADEVFSNFSHLSTAVIHGSKDKRLKLLNTDADIYIINHDGIKIPGVLAALADRPDIDIVIVDEIAQIARHAGTGRYKALNTIVNRQTPRKVWGLTGTPTPNQPTDAWAQCRLLVPERVPPYFNRFRDRTMRQVNMFNWVPRPEAAEIVHGAMQPSIRYTLEECVDLPPCIYETRHVELSPAQAKGYKEMMNSLATEAAEGKILAINEAIKAQKLIQISLGIAYGTEGQEVLFDAGARMEVIREIVEDAGTKVIVFSPFVSVVEYVATYLRSHGIDTEIIHGGVSKNERDRIFSAFQKTSSPKVISANAAAMSHGLTLTEASTIIWAAPIFSNDIFEQANARVRRPGQKHTQLIVMIEGTPVERRYYQRLKDKQAIQGVLLDMVRDSRGLTALV